MKKYLKNNRRLIHNFKFLSLRSMFYALCSMLSAHVFKLLALSSMLLAFLLLCWIFFPDRASSGPYLDSAHGNTAYGVNRTSLSSFNYSTGNCAHCHEQHASINGDEPLPNTGDDAGPDTYLLFKILWVSPAQSTSVCFGCHMGAGSYQSGLLKNYSYSYRAGGDNTLTCPDNISQSFQFVNNAGNSIDNGCGSTVGSSHLLRDIKTLLKNKWGFSNNANYVNSCSGCHNPHRAKRDPHTITGRISEDGKLVSSVSKPKHHEDLTTWQLWGDDAGERMSIYTYWAPKRLGGGYEPDGSSTQTGSNMVDYVGLCTDCHNSTRVINSNRLKRDLYRINWGTGGDFHGTRPRNDGSGDKSQEEEWGDLLEPYKVGSTYQYNNYVLSCTDCHEPHGSPNEFLLRRTVNGIRADVINGEGRWYDWCQTCHYIDFTYPAPIHPPMDRNSDCFNNGGCHRHCDGTPCPLYSTWM